MREIPSMLLILVVGTSVIAEDPTAFQMPSKQNVYFKSYFVTGSAYYQFVTNGTYRKISREHMGIQESDNGIWTQNKSGEITLISKDCYRNIEYGHLSIRIWGTQTIDRLPWLSNQVEQLLADTDQEMIPKKQIEGIERYGYNNSLCRISVKRFQREGDRYRLITHVPRENLRGLIKEIELYLNDKHKQNFHATPMTYKGWTFLLWKNKETSINRSLPQIRDTIDELKPEAFPEYIFARITDEAFQEETVKRQPFIFYPDMNQCLPKADKNKASNKPSEAIH